MSDNSSTTLTFEVDRSSDVPVVRCHGKLVAGVSDMFYDKVHQLIPGTKRIVLDLSDLTRVDSMGLGALVRLYVSARSGGCRLELVNLGKQIRELLGVTHLWGVFAYIGECGTKIV
ncbi:MAG: STAS domain-containing protein [Acidobacteriaceae bacterium]